MTGMTVVDAWKASRLKEKTNITVKKYGEILSADIIKAANKFKESSRPSPTAISIDKNRTDTDTVSLSLLSGFSRVTE